MYELQEPRYWLEPPEPETIGYCAECGQDIFLGEDIWEIKGEWYCEYCIDNSRAEAEKNDYLEDIV